MSETLLLEKRQEKVTCAVAREGREKEK